MTRAYVGIGSNLEPERNVRAAVREIARASRLVGVSTFYRTAPIGNVDDPWFVNGVVAIETELTAGALVAELLRPIEDRLGRLRSDDRNAPRTIDLDLVAYDGALVGDVAEAMTRPFVACPLAELDPRLTLPDGRTIEQLASSMTQGAMVTLAELTTTLREQMARGGATPRRSRYRARTRQRARCAQRGPVQHRRIDHE